MCLHIDLGYGKCIFAAACMFYAIPPPQKQQQHLLMATVNTRNRFNLAA